MSSRWEQPFDIASGLSLLPSKFRLRTTQPLLHKEKEKEKEKKQQLTVLSLGFYGQVN